MSQTATGTMTRVQMRRPGHQLIPHGNVLSYDPQTGSFEVLFDFQKPNDPSYVMTPSEDAELGLDVFVDQNGLSWILVR